MYTRPALAAALVSDAARSAAAVDPASIIPRALLVRRGRQAAAACALLAMTLVTGRGTTRQAWDTLSLMLFPSHVTLEVTPGDGRVRAGAPFTVTARLVGNRAPVAARLFRADGASDEFRAKIGRAHV